MYLSTYVFVSVWIHKYLNLGYNLKFYLFYAFIYAIYFLALSFYNCVDWELFWVNYYAF